MRADDVVGYVFRADVLCPPCTVRSAGQPFDGWAVAPGVRMSVEDNLDEVAAAFGIERHAEHTFDSDDFPKVLFASDAHDETCGRCGTDLT